MERYMYVCKNLCSLLEHQIMEDCHTGQFGLRAKNCGFSYIQLPATVAMLLPFSPHILPTLCSPR